MIPEKLRGESERLKRSVVRNVDCYCAQKRRERAGREKVSGEFGMSYVTLWRRLRDPGRLCIDDLVQIARALDMPLTALLGLGNDARGK